MIVKKIKPKLANGKMPGRARYVRDLTDYMAAPDQGEKLLFLGGVGFHSDDFATRQVEMMSVAHEAVRSDRSRCSTGFCRGTRESSRRQNSVKRR